MRGAQMTERERFERWARRRGYLLDQRDGEYVSLYAAGAWNGWQARARVRKSKRFLVDNIN